jgi:hypothetical protein
MPMKRPLIKRFGWFLPIFDLQRCIDDLFDCGLITLDLPDGL